ncbi:MAG: TonB-dependent receptor plug domain-containing protein [Bacteroidales bacterium]|nr:TonB-dependent receptor plug domain-containing protein [Bacteroidales bacterium]
MKRNQYLISILTLSVISILNVQAQIVTPPDTTGIYGERRDTLTQSVVSTSINGNYLPKGKEIRTEVITAAGLCKMACCNLAESFENSASVTVGYSDAVTGARQIRLLGQNGIYTQMLDENRPVMRGLAAPFGLNYVPGQWLESIQIAKGVTSVINGMESMTGQINLEHRKPTDEKPLFIHASVMNDSKTDFNLASSLQLDDEGKWSTVFLGHADGNFMTMDHNDDGFMDDPRQFQVNLANRWLYFDPSGMQLRFGGHLVIDSRRGGQMKDAGNWKSKIRNSDAGGYIKAGFPLNEANTSNIAVVADYNYHRLDGDFTTRIYDASQHSVFVNLLYQNQNATQHHYTLGLSGLADFYKEDIGLRSKISNRFGDAGAFAEYTFHSADQKTFSAILGLRTDWFNGGVGLRFSPRLTLKWAPSESLVLRANGGRGLRRSLPIADNFGVLASGKPLFGDVMNHILEDSWTFGGNATLYIGGSSTTYFSFDYFRTQFREQMLVDYDVIYYGGGYAITFAPLSSIGGAHSFTDNFQVDFNAEPLDGLTLTLTGRYTNARQTRIANVASDVKPMTSRYKGVLNLQYATHLKKWTFDFTASVNGPCKVWDFMKGYKGHYTNGNTPVYPLLYAQVTKRFKGVDVYIGAENLTNYRQPYPIINADDPFSRDFDAGCVWGPLMGARFYAGIRITIWKTE